MPIELVMPCADYQVSFLTLREELLAAKDPFWGQYSKYAAFDLAKLQGDFESYIVKPMLDASKGIGLKEGYVPATSLWLVDTDKQEILGQFNVRHALNASLLKDGGHIGYFVRPSARRQGYAKLGLQKALAYAKNLNIPEALVTCDARNEASYRTILGVMKLVGGKVDTPSLLEDGFEETNPYHPENRNNLMLRFWLNTGKEKE